VAAVRAVRAESSVVSRLNARPAMTISVSKKARGSTFAVVGGVKELVERFRSSAPGGIEFRTTIDTTRHIRDILGVLRNNALIGLLVIFALLYAFLGLGNALLAALGIPISFLIAFIVMYLTGNTINGSSLFAMIIVLGIVVDEAIIVLENVHRHRQQGLTLREAAIRGTEEVIGPITSGVLTTVAAFLPLMLSFRASWASSCASCRWSSASPSSPPCSRPRCSCLRTSTTGRAARATTRSRNCPSTSGCATATSAACAAACGGAM